MSSSETRIYQVRNMNGDRIRFNDCRPMLLDRRREYRPVKTKRDFYRRFYAGEFGNHGPMWDSVFAFEASGYSQPIAIRTKTAGGRCDYFIPAAEVRQRVESFLLDGYCASDLNFSAQCPEPDKTIQGEAMLSPRGVELFYSTSIHPMRRALAEAGKRVHGLKAAAMLRSRLCPNSFEWLQTLFERYPDHVIEFTTFRYPWGTIPNHNTVIWEVRSY